MALFCLCYEVQLAVYIMKADDVRKTYFAFHQTESRTSSKHHKGDYERDFFLVYYSFKYLQQLWAGLEILTIAVTSSCLTHSVV